MYQRLFLVLVTLFTLIACSANNDETASRIWTDVQGRTMQAEFVRMDPNSNEVVFRKDTGLFYQFPFNKLSQSDQLYINDLVSKSPDLAKVDDPRTSFEKSIGQHLLRISRGRLTEVNETDLKAKDYYAIYYSAHWCPPCRKFTPELVSFYNSYSSRHDNFEIIFVSSDRSAAEMENYMQTANMPWPAVEFDKVKTSHPATQYSGRGIPCLVLIDNKGSVLAHSYSGSKYVGPTSVMNTLKAKLNK